MRLAAMQVVLDETGEEEWLLDTQLYAAIKPDTCRVEVLRSKVGLDQRLAACCHHSGCCVLYTRACM